MISHDIIKDVDVYHKIYNNNEPYPHIIFDDLFDETLIKEASREADSFTKDYLLNQPATEHHDHQTLKHGCNDLEILPPILRLICRYVNGKDFIRFLRKVTGLKSIVGDNDFTGGGLHFTEAGGKLGVHHDFNYMGEWSNPTSYRKCNLIIFLNDEWNDKWGGGLELWDKELTSQRHMIMPKLNRAVLFNIEDAPHGHPQPLKCPLNENRRSLAFYFYDKVPVKNRLYERAYWKENGVLL